MNPTLNDYARFIETNPLTPEKVKKTLENKVGNVLIKPMIVHGGITYKKENGRQDILIREADPLSEKKVTLVHEVAHIIYPDSSDDLTDDCDICIEREAKRFVADNLLFVDELAISYLPIKLEQLLLF